MKISVYTMILGLIININLAFAGKVEPLVEVQKNTGSISKPTRDYYHTVVDLTEGECGIQRDNIRARVSAAQAALHLEPGTLSVETGFLPEITTPEPPCTEEYAAMGCGGTNYIASECRFYFKSVDPTVLFRFVKTEKVIGKNRMDVCEANERAIEENPKVLLYEISHGGGFPTFRKSHCRHHILEVASYPKK